MPMKIGLLKTFGIEEEVIGIWEREYGSELLPVQGEAVKQNYLQDGQNRVCFQSHILRQNLHWRDGLH